MSKASEWAKLAPIGWSKGNVEAYVGRKGACFIEAEDYNTKQSVLVELKPEVAAFLAAWLTDTFDEKDGK